MRLRNCQSCFLLSGGVLIPRQYRLHRLHHRATVSVFCSLLRPCSRALCNHELLCLRLEDWNARTSMRMACSGPFKVTPSPTHTSCQTKPPSLRFQQPTATTAPWESIPETLSHVCTSATSYPWGVTLFRRHSLVPDIGREWISPRLSMVHKPWLVKPHIPLSTCHAKTPHNH